jgi:hypothetical protein
MLMEEDIDEDFFYQYPDHPALLSLQQPYAQILSAPSPSSDSATTSTTLSTSCFSNSASSAEPTRPYDPIELAQPLRSPPYLDLGVVLHDFTTDDVRAALLPGQDGATPGFDQRLLAAASSSDAVQSPGSPGSGKEEDTKVDTTTLPAADEDHNALASAFFGGHQGVSIDMLNRAFAKGVEETKKFLPANNGLLIDLDATMTEHLSTESNPGLTISQVKKEKVLVDGLSMVRENSNGRGRKNRHHKDDLEAELGRNNKLMMPDQEDTDAQEMYRDIMTFNVEEFMKRMRDLRIAKDSESEKSTRKGARGRGRVPMRLLTCTPCSSIVRRQWPPVTSAVLAHCFTEGLEVRLVGTGSLLYQSLVSKRTSVADYVKAYRLFMAFSCFKKVKYIFSNRTIADAVAGKSKLHIVVYGLQHGFQWPGLLHFLANREG